MTVTAATKSAEVRSRAGHPIIDSDGHTVEFGPALFDVIKETAGERVLQRYLSNGLGGAFGWYRLSPEERLDRRTTRPPWWPLPSKNTRDRATATLPRLLYERLDEFGLDFTVLYPSLGLFATGIEDEEVRRAVCRAFNTFHAQIFREFADRMTPVAIIPMHTPQEAVDELDYAVGGLGMKAVMMAGHVRRTVPAVARSSPEAARYAYWLDTLAIDSAYDYDPVWARCAELKIPPTFHSGGMGWGSRTSVTNYMYNHIGHFASAGEATCKALFMGGVTRRFPTLKFAFLECGVGWACNLFSDLIGHWKKRNRESLENYNPARLDRPLLEDLLRRYGGELVEGRLDGTEDRLFRGTNEDPAMLDEWAACGIERPEDIRDLFVPPFYFGCEADDPLNAWAFNSKVNPFGARLQAIFSSDIGHWDVPDMTEVAEEAYELVEQKLITEEDFRDFVFANPVSLWTSMNPDFFEGTIVEKEVRELLA